METGDMVLLYMFTSGFFLIYFLQTSKKSSRSSRLVWISKEFLSKLRLTKEVFKRGKWSMMADGIKRYCPIIQGWGWESQGWPGVRSGKRCEGQQERFLQLHKQKVY